MLLTKLVRPELVGQYALGLALVYPVMMLSNMQLRSVMNSSVRDGAQFGHYLSLRLLMTLAAFAAIFGITRILRYDWQLTEVVLMVGLAYGIETISDVYYARLQLHEQDGRNLQILDGPGSVVRAYPGCGYLCHQKRSMGNRGRRGRTRHLALRI